MATKINNTTTFEAITRAYEAHYVKYPHWQLVDGQTAEGYRVANSYGYNLVTDADMHVENDEGFIKSMEHLTNTVNDYEDGVFTIIFKTNINTGNKDSVIRKFKIGNGFEAEQKNNGIFGMGSTKGGNNDINNFLMSAAIKGFSGNSNSDIADLKLQIARMELERKHEKEIDELENTTSNRILGFVENNSDRVFDLLGQISPMLGIALKQKQPNRTATAQPNDVHVSNVETSNEPPPQGTQIHQLDSHYNPKSVSSDQFLQYASILRRAKPDVNVNIVDVPKLRFWQKQCSHLHLVLLYARYLRIVKTGHYLHF